MEISMSLNCARRSLFNSRYFSRDLSSIQSNPSLHIHKPHLQIDSTKKLPLLQRLHGNKLDYRCSYFSLRYRDDKSTAQAPPLRKKLPLLLRKHGNNINNDIDGDLRCGYFSLLYWDDKSISTRQLHLPFPSVRAQGSCNGVVCLADEYSPGRLALWNPSTNEFKFLPRTCIQLHPDAELRIFYDAHMSFDPISQDFKVVRFVATVFLDDGHQTHATNHVELYSLKSDSWEELSDHRCFDCRLTTYVVATVNGVPYWMAQMKNERIRLLTFDFASKQFSFVDLPDSANRARKLHLAERDGSLAAIIYPGFGKNKFFEVWLRSHDGSWEEVSTISVPGAVEPLGFWTKDELLFKCRGEYLIIFCLDTREAKRLNITSDRKDPYKTFIPCVESGVQLVGKSECENKEFFFFFGTKEGGHRPRHAKLTLDVDEKLLVHRDQAKLRAPVEES